MFQQQNIEVPYPQRELHIRSGSIGLSPAQNPA